MLQELTNRKHLLKDRALMLKKSRDFFDKRGIMEVDVPLLSAHGSIDAHIDLVQASSFGKRCYLHSSPEYGMKRLLAENCGDIYQLSHVFRDHERGERHNPEFMMAEWYRFGYTLEQLIEETIDFVRLFIENLPTSFEEISYQKAFSKYASHYPDSLEERDEIFTIEIEPYLGKDKISIIKGFPPEQAALAQIDKNGLAERFEVFFRGVELGNGYHELTDVHEQKVRLERENQKRESLKKEKYPLDVHFLKALERGVSDCCGVAVGFDRLMMLRHQVDRIDEVIPFTWEVA